MTSAIPAGMADAGFVPLCAPLLAGNEWAYVRECLDTGWVSSVGTFVNRFEEAVAGAVGTPYAVATVNGTAALHTALLAVGIEPDDEVIVPALTFIAPANAIRYVGAWPVFIDAEPDYFQMAPDRLAEFLTAGCEVRMGVLRNRATGRRVRAVLPVHILGHPVDMGPVLELARRFGLAVIEDATESLGADWNGHPVGGLGQVGCFSFNGNKLLTTGGGGMLVTSDARLAERARYLTTQAKDDPIEYVHGAVGYNYRLTNVLAALGVAQMEQRAGFLDRKRAIAAHYQRRLAACAGVRTMEEAAWARSAWWMYTVRIDEAATGRDSRGLMRALAARNIQSRPLWQPLHRSPAHAGAPAAHCPVADRLYQDALSLPCSTGLTVHDQDRVCDAVLEFLGTPALELSAVTR